ncbi:lantibiotic dehydratase [Streptomyces glebosus]|uniref:lantibiotic dehydratase n=1 Tax=Streptomyces glebosus TaxID=249580 RepID=UPI0035314668
MPSPNSPASRGSDGRGYGTAVREVSMRHTPVVRAALEMAGTPVLYRDLARHLAEVSPDVDARTVCAMVDELIAHRFLISSLHPTATELPLRHPAWKPTATLPGALRAPHAPAAGLHRPGHRHRPAGRLPDIHQRCMSTLGRIRCEGLTSCSWHVFSN